jgi:prepilin peptidase CpaA
MSLLALLQAGCLIAFVLLLIAAGWQDLRSMRIANSVSLAIVGTYAIWASAGLAAGKLSFVGVALAIVCAGGLFAIGVLAFAAGALGGGDVKLVAAAGLYAGLPLMTEFLTVTALVGGLLGLAILAGAPVGPALPASNGTIRARLRGGLPYGPAIGAGGVWVAACLGCS